MSAVRSPHVYLPGVLLFVLALCSAIPCGAEGCLYWCPEGDGSSAIPGLPSVDRDFDGDVDITDFGFFAGAFGGGGAAFDFNCSGGVDLVDFAIFASHYGHDAEIRPAGPPAPGLSGEGSAAGH